MRAAQTQQAIGQALAVPLMVLIQPGGGGAALGGPTSGIATSWDVQGYVEKMTPTYGGTSWVVLSSQAAVNTLREAAAILASQYPGPLREYGRRAGGAVPKLEVRRKGVKTLTGRTQVEVARSN
jgi:hypothetical protein